MKYFFNILIFLCSFNAYFAHGQKGKDVLNKEVSYHIGPAVFQGDVVSGVYFSNKKISQSYLSNSNLNVGLGFNYYLSNIFCFKTNFNFLQLNGNDEWGKNYQRMLKFRTYLFDVSAIVEYNYMNRYLKNSIFSASSGIAVINFYPMGKYNGKWYSLQKVGTEGQGLKPGSKKYLPLALSIPINVGYYYILNNRDKFGFEICFRKTFTDYIDDVSGQYYDNNEILNKKGEEAAYLADPRPVKAQAGTYRGNPGKNDNYTFVNLSYRRLLGVKYIIKY